MSDFYSLLRARAGASGQPGAYDSLINKIPKNLLENVLGDYTVGTMDFVKNADDTVTVTASASRNVNSDYHINESLPLKAGTYVLSGCPAGGDNSSTYKIQIGGVGYDTGESLEFTLQTDTTISVYIRIWKGYVPDNLIFKPMICTKEDWEASKAFVPYAPTNRELYEMILALQG